MISHDRGLRNDRGLGFLPRTPSRPCPSRLLQTQSHAGHFASIASYCELLTQMKLPCVAPVGKSMLAVLFPVQLPGIVRQLAMSV